MTFYLHCSLHETGQKNSSQTGLTLPMSWTNLDSDWPVQSNWRRIKTRPVWSFIWTYASMSVSDDLFLFFFLLPFCCLCLTAELTSQATTRLTITYSPSGRFFNANWRLLFLFDLYNLWCTILCLIGVSSTFESCRKGTLIYLLTRGIIVSCKKKSIKVFGIM